MMDTGIEAILQRKAEKDSAKKERKAEREEAGIVNKIIIDKDSHGLYYARYSYSGPVPDLLKGLFTRKERLLALVREKGLQVAE